jgi:hypothetical protein
MSGSEANRGLDWIGNARWIGVEDVRRSFLCRWRANFAKTSSPIVGSLVLAAGLLPSVCVAATPAVPTLTSPANAASLAAGTASVNLVWSAVSGAATYNLAVGTSCGGTSVAGWNQVAASSLVPGLSNGTTYFWRIQSVGSGGTSAFSACRTFSVMSPPAPAVPTLTSPANAASLAAGTASVNLVWSAVSGAATYNLAVGTSCGSTSVAGWNQVAASSLVPGLSNGQTYFWRVQSVGAGGTSAYSSCNSFTVSSPVVPAAPTLTAPPNGVSLTAGTTSATLQWSAVSGASGYNLAMFTGSCGGTSFTGLSTTSASFTLSGLGNGQTYYWRVQSVGAGGTSAYSSCNSFTVATDQASAGVHVPVVTIITHGFQPIPGITEDITWMNEMANAVRLRQGGGVPVYEVIIRPSASSGGFLLETIAPPMTASSKGAIITINWSAAAFCDPICMAPSGTIAQAIAKLLIDNPRLMSLPIHLIDHSRGAAVMSTVAWLLGTRGAWIDQQTTLDPHPVWANDDSVSSVWQNVLFEDNYWRNGGYPDGELIAGAHNTNLNAAFSNLSVPHSAVHTYYHFTIDQSASPPPADGVSFDPTWYQGINPDTGPRNQTGYYFSRNGGGEWYRKTDGVDGYHTDLGGSGIRWQVPLDTSSAGWPNIALQPLKNGYSYQIGESIPVSFYYQDRQNPFDVVFRLDDDTDPYNAISAQCAPLNSGNIAQIGGLLPDSVHINRHPTNPSAFFSLPTTGAVEGSCYLRAEIKNGTYSRFDYLATKISLSVAPAPPALVPPTVLGPGDASAPGLIVGSLTPQFSWTSVAAASGGYGFAISEYPYGPLHIIYSTVVPGGVPFTIPGGTLSQGTRYRWNMTSVAGGSKSSVSNTLYFQTPTTTPTNYSIQTSASPSSAGFTAGGGTKQSGTSVTVSATPTSDFAFTVWTDRGIQVSSSTSYSFVANGNRDLIANFASIVALPGAFSKTGPSVSATGQPTSPTLIWGASSGATSYEYCVDTTNNNSCDGTWMITGTATSATLGGLSSGMTYYWQVRANNAGRSTYANGGSTAYWSFATTAPLPDLTVSSLNNPPGSVTVGASFTVTDTTANQGSSTASASTTRYRLSPDSTITTADLLLSGTRSVPSLPASGTSSGSVTVTVPAGTTPGTYYLGACADDLGAVTEASETNNCHASATTVSVTSPTAAPDLLVTMLTAPTSGTVGGSLAGLSVTIKNQGPASTGAFRVGFYFATSATYTASAVMSNSYCAASSGVAAGAAWTCSGAISIPASLSPGAYYLIAYVDDQSQVTESNEANNWLAATTGLIMLANGTGQPDLLVTALTAPTSGTVGGSLAGLSVTAKNQGTTAAGTHRIGFYFSTSATYTTSAVMSSSYCAASTGVAAGAAWTCSGAISIPAWLSPGGYYLIAYADDQSQVTESNETNNWLAATTGLITLH